MQEVRVKNKWEEWILFILKGVEHTAEETISQIQSIKKLFVKTQDKIKKDAPKFYNKELIEILFEHPYSKIEYLTDRMGVSRITASKYLKGLRQIGILSSKQVWKETLYINSELFDLLRK